MSQIETRACRGLCGAIRVPGDKSISHRALMLGSLAGGQSQIDNFLPSGDCLATLGCLQALGVAIDRPAETTVTVHGVAWRRPGRRSTVCAPAPPCGCWPASWPGSPLTAP
jgi:3-phosphoshikimate 1-carboxyvinyltransferase